MKPARMRTPRWLGTVAQVGGAAAMASHRVDPALAYAMMLAGAAIWGVVALAQQDWALATLNLAFVAIDLVGYGAWGGLG